MSSASALETPSLMVFGRALDEVLRLLEAEAGDLADDLDDVDLLGAGVGEHDVELGLLLDAAAAAAAGAGRRQRRRPEQP